MLESNDLSKKQEGCVGSIEKRSLIFSRTIIFIVAVLHIGERGDPPTYEVTLYGFEKWGVIQPKHYSLEEILMHKFLQI